MKKAGFTLLVIFLSVYSFGQSKKMLVYDLENNTVDSLEIVDFDPNITQAKTNFNIGNYNNLIEILDLSPPTENTFPEAEFTRKEKASHLFDLTKFPLRTSVKIFKIENDSLKNFCSGSMISRRHVLTAAHCVTDYINGNNNDLSIDSLEVFPVFDNGEPSNAFNSSDVSKVYFFKDWTVGDSDHSILELKEPIGDETGWIAIGFENDQSILEDRIFYKFSYPNESIPILNTNEYNGDTLFYNYGKMNVFPNQFMGANSAIGLPGDSGSSIIHVNNDDSYTTYGTASYSGNFLHSRISDWKYFAFLDVIKNDLISHTNFSVSEFSIFPNPTLGFITIKSSLHLFDEVQVYNGIGQDVTGSTNITKESDLQINIDMTFLTNGIYFVKSGDHILKIVKS